MSAGSGSRGSVSNGSVEGLGRAVRARVSSGARLAAMLALPEGAGTRLVVVLSDHGELAVEQAVVPAGETRYPSLTPDVPAAGWYERGIQDLYGLEPVGHPQPDPLVLARAQGAAAPRPGSLDALGRVTVAPWPVAPRVRGEGVFTIPYGPVRSGVFESVEYLVETSGEDIPHLRTRVFYKHRGIDARFAGLPVDDGVLLAERVEGVASVAHAIAYCQAVERAAGAAVPPEADLVRLVHAELERIANHLETVVRHTEAAGQAVALAVFSHHKERVQRLRARLCGSRFGRGVVVPGGVSAPLGLRPAELWPLIGGLERGIRDDLRMLMETPSFVDRLRGTGVLAVEEAARLAVVGPLGRASGLTEDVRVSRPYGAYEHLGHRLHEARTAGDALARQHVRIDEIGGAFHLLRQAIDQLEGAREPETWQVALELAARRNEAGEEPGDGGPRPTPTWEVGWAESPQGEVLSLVELDGDRVAQVRQRSASFHNLAGYASAFPKDIFTDLAFIEASFGLSIAGAAG